MKNGYSINDFRLATPEEVSKFVHGHAILVHPRNITPYYVYRFLRDRYGPPNIPSESHGDTLRVSWEYVLKGPRAFIAIHDWKLDSWSFSSRFAQSYKQLTEEQTAKYDDEARKDARILLAELMQYLKKTKIRSHDEHSYQYIINIHLQSYDCGEYFLDLLEKPKNKHFRHPILAETSPIASLDDTYNAWAAAMSFVLSVEGLFNMIYEIYLNREIDRDEQLRNHLYRMSLTDRWLMFSLLCSCFSKSLDRKSRGYRNLSMLVKMRNYWAHANIGEDLRTYIVEEDGLEFAVRRNTKSWDLSMSNMDCALVKKIKKYVDQVKLEVLNAMKLDSRKSFSKALEQEYVILDKEGRLVL